jgi:hypothetical protein
MKIKIAPLPIVLLTFVFSVSAQLANPGYATVQPQQQPADPMANISFELSNISRSVAQLSERLKNFVDKFEKVGGLTLSEKQQRFIMGLEILVRSEQRVATLQRAYTDLLEKQIQVKSRLTQIELDLKPQSIEQSTIFEGGSSQAPEYRENRRNKLLAEQRSLVTLIQQVERNIYETDAGLREAQSHVARLRRSLLPQIEKEIGEASY